MSYLIGNPPFIGYSNHSKEQKEDRLRIMGKKGGVLDYVACWFAKAARYMRGTKAAAAFVATSSICQGQQVQPLWQPLMDEGLKINFAHQSFPWASESFHQAQVHVVVIGFSWQDSQKKLIFSYTGGEGVVENAKSINAYLVDAPTVFISRRSKPICDVKEMIAGGKPTDGGHLLMTPEEMNALVEQEPGAEKFIRRFSMGAEFIRGIDRYCLWLVDCPPEQLKSMPLVSERVLKVKESRENSAKAATRKKAETPWLFDEIRYEGEGNYLALPAVSSGRRPRVPIGFVTNGMIPGNKLFFIPDATLFEFGVLLSKIHNAWMAAVTGRFGAGYNYSNTIVYNNFVWPSPDDAQREAIESAAQAVLDAREKYENATLEDLYDPDNDSGSTPS